MCVVGGGRRDRKGDNTCVYKRTKLVFLIPGSFPSSLSGNVHNDIKGGGAAEGIRF